MSFDALDRIDDLHWFDDFFFWRSGMHTVKLLLIIISGVLRYI